MVSNALYYSLIGLAGRERAWECGAALGLAAGVGAITLPGPLGLGQQPDEQPPWTQLLTVAWYLAGGLAAAAAYRFLTAEDGAPSTGRAVERARGGEPHRFYDVI